jgi:cytochrome b561
VTTCGKGTLDHAGNFFDLDDVWTQRRQCRKLGRNKMGARIVEATGESAKPAQWHLKITFWLDVTLLVSICASQTVRFTGLVLHEWLGLAMVGMVLAHLLLAWSWIASQSRRFFTLQSIRARINYLLNLSLFAAVTAVIFSGILISQKAIPTLTGSKAAPDMDWRWDSLHNQFSAIVLMLVGFHLAVNWEWVLAAGQKIFRRFLEGGS